jgi:signal transduction histidine kinase
VEKDPGQKGLQHSLNNPLAALLAELQLLELEDLKPEHREAVERAIGLVRRVVALVRERIPPSQL